MSLKEQTVARHIVVEGPIGVGKTTLTQRLATAFGYQTVFEAPTENPFLERFYQEPDHYALQTQLYFLFQRVKQLRGLQQGQLFSAGIVSDFMLEKDPLFAELTLDDDEYDLYQQTFQSLVPSVPQPDLVVYLQAPLEVLQQRIAKRGIRYEQRINPGYLEALVEAYQRYFLSYYSSPLLVVNAENLDFLDNEQHFQLLLDQIQSSHHGRGYFNPVI